MDGTVKAIENSNVQNTALWNAKVESASSITALQFQNAALRARLEGSPAIEYNLPPLAAPPPAPYEPIPFNLPPLAAPPPPAAPMVQDLAALPLFDLELSEGDLALLKLLSQ